MSKEPIPLEALEIIRHTTDLDLPNDLNGYKNELDIIEKALKALEIIKEEPIFPFYVSTYKTYEEMITDRMGFAVKYGEEELKRRFDLLREVLEND